MSYSSSIQTSFSGPSTTSTYPPHNGFAVGSNYVVMIDGSQIEWTNLTGGSPTVQSVYSFFSPLSPTGGLYDQRVVYDSVNQRFVAIMEYLAPDGTTTAMDIAVSKDANPNDGWTFSQLNTTVTINGQSTDSDRPTLAVDGLNIYISAAQYNINVSGYAGTENWVIGDTAGAGGGIYGGGTLSVTASEVMPSTQGIFAVASGNNGKTYYASDSSSGGQIVISLQTYDKTTKTFSTTSTIALGNIDQGGSYTSQQQGTSLLLDAGGDNRIANMVYANGFLYGVAEMKPSGSSVPLVHWFKIDVSNPSAPSLVAQGDISGAAIGTGVATFNPSIAVDASGDVVINFTASGPNMYPADYYVFQGGSDPAGSFSAPVLYQASTSFFDSGDGSSVQAWGANSSATVDPNNPNSFWISNEYVASGWWQTSVARIGIQNSAIGPAIVSIAASGTGITNGAGDLNAGKVVTLTVNFSAAVTVNASGGTPTLTLNDGGTASYTGGSGGTALIFSYTVAAGQNAADLIVAALNLNGGTITGGNGNAANLTGATNYNPAGTLQIDTTAPTIASIVATGTGITNGTGSVSTGQVVNLTVNLSEAVTVNTTGGTPTLTLNDGGTASYTGGSGGTALAFSYTVAAGQTTSDLAISSFNLNGAAVSDGAGNATNLSGATNFNPAGTLQVNSTTTVSSQIQTLFSGPSTTSNYPPHNGLAVGSNFVVMIEGSLIEWTNLTGGSPTQQSVYSFFSSLSPTGGLFDQRIAYDSVNQRFVAMMEYLAPDGTTTAMDIAVSKDSNPNDGWTFSQLNTTVTINGQSTDSDRPTLAVDGSSIYISAAQYNINVSGYAGTENWVIGDTAGAGGGIYGGGTLSVTASEVMPSTQGIFAVASGNNGKTYYASDSSSGGQIVVALQTYDKATKTFSTTSTIALGNIDQGGSYTVQQKGTSLRLDAVDNRIASMVYANGYLYAVAEMKPSGSSVPLVHWFKIDVSNPSAPSLVAQGNISGAAIGIGVATFDPSVAVDAAGDVIINFTASGPNMYPADYYVFQGGGSPAGSFSAPILYQASTSFFNSGDGSSVQRWGLNSSATVDPNSPNSFWISSEYVANNWWQTSVAKIAIQNSTGSGPTISSIAASGTGITNGSGDLNPGKVVTLTVNFGAVVTVNTSGGMPTLALNDGGSASYTGGSGGTALTFSYTVAAGQNTADLIVSAFNLNGATITGGNGNAANLTGATNYNPAGTLQIDTTAPTIASIVATGTGITNGTGSVSTGQVVTLTVNLSEAVTVNTTGGTPTLILNDGGTASYTGGSGGTALAFSYTVAAGQTTSDLAIASFKLNGAAVSDGAGNATNLSGATNYNPAGTLQVNSTTTTTGVPKYSHIVVVVEENHNYDQIAGNSQAPYINSLMAGGASLTNMKAEAHPSQPDYFALYAGSTFGTTDDNSYSLPDPTLYTVLHNAGLSFTGYVDEGGIGSDFNHDPWVSFPEGRTVQTDFTSFPALFANGNYSSLPTVSYVIPSVTNDMHDGTIAQGDTWLQQNLSAYAQWAVNNNSLLIVTWDENDDSTSEAASNQVPTLLYGANVVSGNYSTAYNHYNLLSTITNSFGLTAPNNAATVAPIQVFGTAAGGAAPTVDQDGVAEIPALTISNNSLTVQAGGSVPLGITAAPVDSDDKLSLSISGLPSYESITAPAGNTVTSSLQSNGTFTWTITEGSSTTGKPLTGLTLSSSYTGTDHPVATFTVTASNTTSGETATSVAQTMIVTDPPAATSNAAGSSSAGSNDASSRDAGHIGRLAAMMDQFAAAGWIGGASGPVHQTFYPIGGSENTALLAAPHFRTG